MLSAENEEIDLIYKYMKDEYTHQNPEEHYISDYLVNIMGRHKFAELFFSAYDFGRWKLQLDRSSRINKTSNKYKPITNSIYTPEAIFESHKYENCFRYFNRDSMESILSNKDSPRNLKKFIQFNLDQDYLEIDYKKFIYESIKE